MQHPRYLTTTRAAELLPIGSTQVINHIKNGNLKAIRNPLNKRVWLIEYESFLEFKKMYDSINPDRESDANADSVQKPELEEDTGSQEKAQEVA